MRRRWRRRRSVSLTRTWSVRSLSAAATTFAPRVIRRARSISAAAVSSRWPMLLWARIAEVGSVSMEVGECVVCAGEREGEAP